jgi:hypothetical protein
VGDEPAPWQYEFGGFRITCPEGARLGRRCDDPECAPCHGVIRLVPGDLDVGCGCGYWVSTRDGLTTDEAHAAFDAHECPLRGVELSAEEILDIVNDPGGHRRVQRALDATAAEEDGE